MKVRESHMPEEKTWEGFFSPESTLRSLGLTAESGDVIEFGCGYGTFTIAAARIIRGIVHTLDIEPEMVTATQLRAEKSELANVRTQVRDFVKDGTGLNNESVGYAMLFNILHAEDPQYLLREAYRVLRHGGLLAIMHWRYDPATPRGPSMAIRPQPEQCLNWAMTAGFGHIKTIELPPYHYGLLLCGGRKR